MSIIEQSNQHHRPRDRRRRPTAEERRAIFLRADGRCQNCGSDLGPDYHNAHLAAYSNGGPTDPDNVQAWCPDCNLRLGVEDVEGVGGLRPRDWQAEALPVVLKHMYATGVATVNAAPGAGKTLFAGFVFKKLLEAGLVERAVIVAPATIIAPQWEAAFKRLGIFLDTKPRDGWLEHRDCQGLVVMYQGLPGTAQNHHDLLVDSQTLVIFDEVHHIAEKASWGVAVKKMVGDLANNSVAPAGVLNLTGTLFRSGRSKRISTVRYEKVNGDGEEKLEAVADWTIRTADLVGVELRSPNLYVYSGQARLVDTYEEAIVSGSIGDLDEQQRETVLRGLDTSPVWLRGYVAEALRLLDNQLVAVNREMPLKLLYCARGVKEAELAAEAINKLTGQEFARLIHNKIPQAEKKLWDATRERKPCAIVQVNMASEGFDCPEVSTIAYASNVTADLRIMQVIARAMRLTDYERACRRMLPAQILIPENPDLMSAFTEVLSDIPRYIDDEAERCPVCGNFIRECVCPKPPRGTRCRRCWGAAELIDPTVAYRVCVACALSETDCTCQTRRSRYQLIDISAPEFDNVNVIGQSDGKVTEPELRSATPELLGLGVPEVYHPGAVVYSRRHQAPWTRPAAPAEESRSAPTATVTMEPAGPRDLVEVYRSRMHQAAKWMHVHIGHDSRYSSVEHFQSLANKEAFIPKGGRDQALPKQLKVAARWMCARIVEHCEHHGEEAPIWTAPR